MFELKLVMRHYKFGIVIIFLFVSCSSDNVEKFYNIPYGTNIDTVRDIFNKKNIKIVSEDIESNNNTIVINIIINGSYFNEECEVMFVFWDGIFQNGGYKIFGYSKERLSEIMNNIIKKLTNEFKKEPIITYEGSLFYWVLDNKIIVSIFNVEDFLIIGYTGEEYLLHRNGA